MERERPSGEPSAVHLFGQAHTLARSREEHKEQLKKLTSLSPRRKRSSKKKRSTSRLREREAVVMKTAYSMTEAEYNYDFAVPVYERSIPKYDPNVYIPNGRLDAQRQPETEGARARRRRRAAAARAADASAGMEAQSEGGAETDKAVEVCRLELMKRVFVREGYLERLKNVVVEWARPAESPLMRKERNATVLHLLGHLRLTTLAVVDAMRDWVNASVLSSAAAASAAAGDAAATDAALDIDEPPPPIFMYQGRCYSRKMRRDLDFVAKFPRMTRLLQTPASDMVGNPLMIPRPRPASPRSPRSRAASPERSTRRPGSPERSGSAKSARKLALVIPIVDAALVEAEAFMNEEIARARAARPLSPPRGGSPKPHSPKGGKKGSKKGGKKGGKLPAARGAKKAPAAAADADGVSSATATSAPVAVSAGASASASGDASRKVSARGSPKRRLLKSPAGKKLAAEQRMRRSNARKEAAASSLRDTATPFEFFETDTGKSRMQRLMPLYTELSNLSGLNCGNTNAMLSYTAPDSPVIDQLFPGKKQAAKHRRYRHSRTRTPSRSPPRTPSAVYGRKVPTLQDIAELAHMRAPPHAVSVVMEAVCRLFGEHIERGTIRGQKKPDYWPMSAVLLKDGTKLRGRMMNFDHTTVPLETVRRVTKMFNDHPDLQSGAEPGKAVCRPIGRVFQWASLVMQLEMERRGSAQLAADELARAAAEAEGQSH